MTDFKVNSRHQIERGGRMYVPNEVVPGVKPGDAEDAALIEQGLLVEAKVTKRRTKASGSKPAESKDRAPVVEQGSPDDAQSTTEEKE